MPRTPVNDWDSIKANVECHVNTIFVNSFYGHGIGFDARIAALQMTLENKLPVVKNFETIRDACISRIHAWDIRLAGKLRELFPDAFPRSLRKGDLIAEYSDTGWILSVRG